MKKTKEILVVGLTGNMGTGKSTVRYLLDTHPNIATFDCDYAAKEAAKEPESAAFLVSLFGADVIKADKSVDFKKIAAVIFNDSFIKRKYEIFIHEKVWNRIVRIRIVFATTADCPVSVFVIESAIIIEIGWKNYFDEMVLVTCSPETQRERLRKNRSMTDAQIAERLKDQMDPEEKRKSAGYIISTDCSEEELRTRVQNLANGLMRST